MKSAEEANTPRSTTKRGFTLVELMVALAIGAFLTTGIVRVVQAANSGFRLQQGISALQETARFAIGMMRQDIAQAGYRPEPWLPETEIQALANETVDAISPLSDRISITRYSPDNCYGNPNPDRDSEGRPRYFLMESTWSANSTGNLTQTCRYGLDAGSLVTQINHLGLVENIEAFQVLFAEDHDGDGNANRWVTARNWQDEAGVLAVRLAMLVASPEPLAEPAAGSFQLLGEQFQHPADGRVRRVFQTTVTVRGRLK